MTDELTPEQGALMYAVRDEYIEKAHTYVEPDLRKINKWVLQLHRIDKTPPPKVVIVGDYDEAKAKRKVKKVKGFLSAYDKNRLHWDDSSVHAIIREAVTKAVAPLANEDMNYRYGNYLDFGWIAAQDFYTRIGVLHNEYFNKYKQLCDLGIYDTFHYEGLCVVVKQPLSIKKAHEERLEKLQLKQDLVEADKRLNTFIQKHATRVK